MGVEHGAFCLGCCWFLMALLFVGGIMNLYWSIGLTLYVLLEKLIPTTNSINVGKIAGGLLILGGVGIIITGFVNLKDHGNGGHGGDQFLSLSLCLGMLVCVVAVAGALLPAVPGVPVMPHSVEFDNIILTNNQKDSIHQNY